MSVQKVNNARLLCLLLLLIVRIAPAAGAQERSIVLVNLFNNHWTSRVRLWAIDGGDTEAAPATPSLEARFLLLAAACDGAAGKLPPTQGGLELSRKSIAVTASGSNPDVNGTVLRLWELSGAGGACRVKLPAGAAKVTGVDLRGRPHGPAIDVNDGGFDVTLKAFAPASFLMEGLERRRRQDPTLTPAQSRRESTTPFS